MNKDRPPTSITPTHKKAIKYSTITWLIALGISFITYPIAAYLYAVSAYTKIVVGCIKTNFIVVAIFKRSILAVPLSAEYIDVVICSIVLCVINSIIAFAVTSTYMIRFYRNLNIGTLSRAAAVSFWLLFAAMLGIVSMVMPLNHGAVYALNESSSPYALATETSLVITGVFMLIRISLSILFYRSV